MTCHPSGVFETVQRRIDRPFRQIEHTTAALTQRFDDGVSMRWTVFEDRHDQRLEMALELLGAHTK
jgi:hypothetical protein